MSEPLPRNFILILCGTIIVFVVAIVLYTQEQIRQQTEIIESERLITINQIASSTELRIDNAIKILQILSKDEGISSPPSATSIDDKLHGIPENLDIDRRKEMRTVFDIYGGFQNMLFLLPNGDVYINEPFFFQKNLTVSNFAFRDWYKEVVATHDVVVSDVVISKSSGKPNVVIALPVFSQNGSFQGILTGSLNLDMIQEKLEELKSYSGERIIIMDGARTVVADSAGILKGRSLPFEIIVFHDDAIPDEDRITIDTINSTKMVVAHDHIKTAQKTWTIISIQPYDEAFRSVNATIKESFILVTFIVVIAIGSVYTVNRLFQRQVMLRKQVEDFNASLVKTQTLLLKSEEKFRNLYNISPDAIMVFDMNGIVTSYNEKFKDLFGYSSEELLGKSVFGIVKDDKLDLAHSYFDELQKIGILENKENWLKRKDGTVFHSLFSCSSMTDHNNAVIGYISVIKNIEEIYDARKKLQESKEKIDDQYDIIQEQLKKLKEADKLKDEFSMMITHELKTPLVTIHGYVEMLKDGLLGTLNKEQIGAVNELYSNSQKLDRLIDDILTAIKIDIKKIKFNISEVLVDEFMDEIIKTHKPMMIDKNIDFINTTNEKFGIKSDKERLAQVLANLIKNSVDFVPEKGRIEINAKNHDKEVVFYVKDNGIGIPKEKQQDLFKKFYQIDTSLKRKHGGTGLGLTICKGIVEGLGGKIWLESEEGKGTTVYFTIPKNSEKIITK
jgi:PAS domain S-box-containing protein